MYDYKYTWCEALCKLHNNIIVVVRCVQWNCTYNNNDLYSRREKCSYKAHTINDIIWFKYITTYCNVIAHKSHKEHIKTHKKQW